MNTEKFNILLQKITKVNKIVNKHFNTLYCTIPEKYHVLQEQCDSLKKDILHDSVKVCIKELIFNLRIVMDITIRFNFKARTDFNILKKYIYAATISNEIINFLLEINAAIDFDEFKNILQEFNMRYNKSIKDSSKPINVIDLKEFCDFLEIPFNIMLKIVNLNNTNSSNTTT